MLQYVAETNCHNRQYYQSHPQDVKVLDIEVEGNAEYVYIPLHEMEDVVGNAQQNHEDDCTRMQTIIDKQRKELDRLKEQNSDSSPLNDGIQHDHLSGNAEFNWVENHEEKMRRITDHIRYLTIENGRLRAELEGERERFEYEKSRLRRKVEEARDEIADARQILSLERSYFETAIKLLEVGLERETNNVKALEYQLMQYKSYHNNHRRPFHDDLSPFETWETYGAHGEQEEARHHAFDQQFQPIVMPRKGASNYPKDSHIYSEQQLFQAEEPQNFHTQQNERTAQQHFDQGSNTNTSRRRPTIATTTVMGASSVRDNLGINDIRDSLYH